jgi:glucokinase
MMKKRLGLDLGGTHVKAAVVGPDGELLQEFQVRTPASRQVDEVAAMLIEVSRRMIQAHPDVEAIGVGAPGLVDLDRRIIRNAPNFPTWCNVPLAEMIAAEIHLPVSLENDVNCFGLAEHRWGAGQGFDYLVALAIGTGIGGAIIIDGKLYRGGSGGAAELGHISVDLWGPRCNCGNLGCVERYLGEEWYAAAAREALGDESLTSPRRVSERADAGDEAALHFIEGRGEILGVACVSLINAFDPKAIIIGGGVSKAGEPLFTGVNRAVRERLYPATAQRVKILPAKLGTISGAMGAAILDI